MANVIEIKPLTRVEGHGIARVYLDGASVERVELSLTEPPRLFEALLLGKHYQEIPDIICRICSLCSTIHRVTALLAVEDAFGLEVSEEVRLYRQLIVYGGHIQSHALHLFCLALPDYINASGFAELAREQPELLKQGLRIKATGNKIQELVGGRLIHPVNVKLGGMGQRLSLAQLKEIKQSLTSVLPDIQRAVETFASFVFPSPDLPQTAFMGVTASGVASVFGDAVATSSGLSFNKNEYMDFLEEKVNNHSHAKVSTLKGEVVTVGALARLNMGLALTPKAQSAFQQHREHVRSCSIWGNNFAQAIELLFAAESALEIVERLLEKHGLNFPMELPLRQLKPERGTAITEAPRGTLIHSYEFDSHGLCTNADIITPTAINQAAIQRDILTVAKSLHEVELCTVIEMLIRAYDPCISCAVHVLKL